jgi:REP element-mobilizing transposase RayT
MNTATNNRKSIRLKGYDYTLPGAYFVTLVAWQRQCRFGEIVGGKVHLSQEGRIIETAWQRLPAFFPIRIDKWVIMPNHFHAIVWIIDSIHGRSAGLVRPESGNSMGAGASPLPNGTLRWSLGAIIQNFKSTCTLKINRASGIRGAPAWQRNYYERIIRSPEELQKIAKYIEANPSNWNSDPEFNL